MADDFSPQTTVFDLMEIGYAFAKIGQLRGGRKLGPTRRDPEGLVQGVRNLCNSIEELGLPKSARLAEKLLGRRLTRLKREVQRDPDAILWSPTAEELRDNLKILWDRVADEASREGVHVVRSSTWESEFREFVRSPREYCGLRPAYTPELPRELDHNLEQAARHIEVGLMGGTIFFLLRAVEAVLQQYCSLLVEEARADVPWGDLCGYLNRRECEAPAHLIEEIVQLKDSYRNPVMHVTDKELVLDRETALNVLIRCKSCVNHMVEHLVETGKVTVLAGSPAELVFDEE